MRTISESSDIEAIHVDDTFTLCDHDDFLILNESEDEYYTNKTDSNYKNEVKKIIIESGLKDESLILDLINKLSTFGLNCLEEFEEDIAPKIYRKLKNDLQLLISDEDKAKHQLTVRLKEWMTLKSIFSLQEKFSLNKFTALEEFNNGKWSINDQLIDAKKLLDLNNQNYKAFTVKLFKLLFYLIKRKQNLDSFIREFSNVFRYSNTILLSLRMLIYYLLENSDSELRQRLINLLSISNPVPLLNPVVSEANNQVNYELLPELYWLLDNQVPMFLSFGFGNCKGKSRFINDLILTNYELHKESVFFDGTIDIQFDKNFTLSTKRKVHIADAHGCLSVETVEKLSPLFDGFLVHINDPQKHSINFLRLLRLLCAQPNCQYVFVIIRDVKEMLNLQNPIDEYSDIKLYDHLRLNKKIYVCSFPNLSDPHVFTFDYLEVFREYFYEKIQKISLINRTITIQDQYKEILDDTQVETINEISTKIKSLIDYIRDTKSDESLFDLYPIFCKYSRTKIELNKIHFFSLDEKMRFQLGQKCYKYISTLENFKGEQRCQAVLKFQELIFSKYKLIVIPIFVQYMNNLLQYRALTSSMVSSKTMSNGSSGSLLSLVGCLKTKNNFISYDIFWRELIQLFIKNPKSGINLQVQSAFNEFVLAGDPFEILDGDNMFFNFNFLSNVFQPLAARIKIVSVIGPQNSGKSTLLNYMFGCDFCVSDGRTTKGIYGSLIKSNIPEYDYYLILDTEGLQSKERDDPEYDRKITLFCFAVSNVVIVNVKDQITADISRMLEFCADSLKQIHMTTVPKPEVYFVLNQQADPNSDNHLIAMRKIILEFKENNLDSLLDFSEEYFKTLPSAFNTITTKVNNQRVFRCLATSQEFIEKVNCVANEIIKYNHELKRDNQPFKDMRSWIEFAHIIFSTINKFPNLTYFKDVNERQQNDRIREWMRGKMEKEFSSQFKNFLSNVIKESSYEDPNNILNQHFFLIQERLGVELESLCQICGTTAEIRARNSQFLDVQISHTKNAWLREFLIDKQKECIKSTVSSGKGKIDSKIREIIQRNQIITTELATVEFDQLFERILNEIKKEIDENNLTTNACAYIYSLYIIYEKELFNIKCFEDFIRKDEVAVINSLNEIKTQLFFSVKQTCQIENETKLMSEELSKFNYLRQDNISELYLASCVNIEKAFEKLKKISKKNLINVTLDEFGLYVENEVIEFETTKANNITIDQLNIKNIPKLISISELKDKKLTNNNGSTLQTIKNFFGKFSDKPIITSFANSVALTSSSCATNLNVISTMSDEKQLIETMFNINEVTSTKLFCQYIKRRFTKLNRKLDDLKDLFDYKLFFRKIISCVEKKLKSNISGSRPVELEIVQGVVSDVNHEIKLCDEELGVFNLRLSIEAKNIAHQIAFKKLYEFYISNLKNTVELNLLNLINEKEKLFKFFIAQVVPDSQKDTENAELIGNTFKETLKMKAMESSKEIIRQAMVEHAPLLSRLQIQKNCDIIVSCTNDQDWIFDYVVNPTKTILSEFEQQWSNIEANLNIKIKKVKDNLVFMFDDLKEKLNDLFDLINKLNNDRDYFVVNHLFEVNEIETTQNNNNAYSNLHYQGIAASKFVFDYLTHCFSDSYKFDNVDLKLNLKEADIKHKSFLNEDFLGVIRLISKDFEKCSIGNLRYFIINLLERIAFEKENFLKCQLDFKTLDETDKLYDFYLNRVRSCEKQCPCCGKPCDAEHFKVQVAAGSENNKHSCSRGHQFRGMNGFKVHETNQPSFKICEEMNDTDLIMIGNKKMKWSEYKKLNSDWEFDTPLDIDVNTWKGKACNIWAQIGVRLSKHFEMEYVEFNCRQEDVLKPIHFILALDSSTSMRGDKWNALMSSLSEFLAIRSEEGNEEDVITILTFGSETIENVSKAKIEKRLLDHVEYVGYYATYFSIVLQKMIQTIHENLTDNYLFGLVLMSDGKPTFIENAQDIMEKVDLIKDAYESKIYKFWSIGFGNENNDFSILKNMAEKFREKGKFLNSDSAGGLVQVYTEIARDNTRIKQ